MSSSLDQMDLQARISDLERQMRGVETLMLGRGREDYTVEGLRSLYWEACRRVRDLAPREVHLWSNLIQGLTTTQLLLLGRLTGDAFPWKPFLALLDHASVQGYLVDDATEHILGRAQDLLNAQGLWLLTPADLMGTPLAIQTALASV